jgi:uncharacterized protein YjbI with pentapeptide repeats
MMRAPLTGTLMAAVLLAPITAVAQTQVVLVEAQENGQGVLRGRGRECFVVTPQHVVGESAATIGIVMDRQARASSELVRILPGDLAILRITDASGIACEPWLPLDNFAGMLRSQTSGTLVMREADGSRSLLPVVFTSTDDEAIYVRPARPEEEIRKSMSGASLLINGALAGLLLSVEDAVGTVYQLDDIMRVSAGYFDGEGTESARPLMELTDATTLLDRAVQARDGSSQGQTDAIAALLTSGLQFNDVDWSGVNLVRASLARASLSGANLHFTDLSNANAAGVNLSGAGLRFAKLTDAALTGAMLSGAYAPFVDAQNARLEGADLSRGNFSGGDFRGARLEQADLRGASFAFADLRGAVLDGADLTGSYFPGAIFDETVSVKDAVLKDTDFIGAAAGMVAWTDAQRAGACRHEVRLPWEGAIEWDITLREQWESPRYSTGLEFESLNSTNVLFTGFGDRSLPLCSTPIDAAVGHYAPTPGIIHMNLDRKYLGKARRRTAVRARVDAHTKLLSAHLGDTHVLKGDGSMLARWHAVFREAAKKTEPVSDPYVTDDQMLLLLLKAGVLDAEFVLWARSAEARFRFEPLAREEPGGFEAQTAWPALFPEKAPWQDLPEDRVDVYRQWTEARVPNTPMRLVSRGRINASPANRTVDLSLVIPGDRINGSLGTMSWTSGLQQYAKERGIAHERVRAAAGSPGLSVYFVLDRPPAEYRFEIPASVDVPRDARLEVVLDISRIEPVMSSRGLSAAVLYATPTEVRIRAQRDVMWTQTIAPSTPPPR